jgi:hypothetical protein
MKVQIITGLRRMGHAISLFGRCISSICLCLIFLLLFNSVVFQLSFNFFRLFGQKCLSFRKNSLRSTDGGYPLSLCLPRFMERLGPLLPLLILYGNFDIVTYFDRQAEYLLICSNVRGIVEWFKNGRKKVKITRVTKPISQAQLELAIEKAVADSTAATENEQQTTIQHLRTCLSVATTTIDKNVSDHAAKLQGAEQTIGDHKDEIKRLNLSLENARAAAVTAELDHATTIQHFRTSLNVATTTINKNASDYAAKLQKAEQTIGDHKDEIKRLNPSLENARAAAVTAELDHEKELVQVCLRKKP